MEFKEIATVSGKGGLFKILNPTRTGVILESLDEKKTKLVVNANAKVSVLKEISIYTTDAEGTVSLEEVMKKIHQEFSGNTGLSKTSDNEELKSFLKHVLPSYDQSRVYVSDIRKLVTWYEILASTTPELFSAEEQEGEITQVAESADNKATSTEADMESATEQS